MVLNSRISSHWKAERSLRRAFQMVVVKNPTNRVNSVLNFSMRTHPFFLVFWLPADHL